MNSDSFKISVLTTANCYREFVHTTPLRKLRKARQYLLLALALATDNSSSMGCISLSIHHHCPCFQYLPVSIGLFEYYS